VIDSGPDEPRRPPADTSWVQTEPVRATPPRPGGGWRRHGRWLFPLAALIIGLLIGSAGKSAPDDNATASKAAVVVTATVTTTAPAATVTAPARTKTPAACAKAQTAKIEAITPKTSAAIAKYKPLAQACRDAS
jgi:hypothetical protein